MGLGEIQTKLTAAHAPFLRRFDAANAHDADNPDDAFEDRSAQVVTMFGGAAVIRDKPIPERATAVHAVLEAWVSASTTPSSWPARCCPASEAWLGSALGPARA